MYSNRQPHTQVAVHYPLSQLVTNFVRISLRVQDEIGCKKLGSNIAFLTLQMVLLEAKKPVCVHFFLVVLVIQHQNAVLFGVKYIIIECKQSIPWKKHKSTVIEPPISIHRTVVQYPLSQIVTNLMKISIRVEDEIGYKKSGSNTVFLIFSMPILEAKKPLWVHFFWGWVTNSALKCCFFWRQSDHILCLFYFVLPLFCIPFYPCFVYPTSIPSFCIPSYPYFGCPIPYTNRPYTLILYTKLSKWAAPYPYSVYPYFVYPPTLILYTLLPLFCIPSFPVIVHPIQNKGRVYDKRERGYTK